MAIQNMNDLGVRIAALRRERGLTQDELATRMNITPQAISKWERGAGLPDLTLVPYLATALGVTVGELLGETATPPQGELPEIFEELALVARCGAIGCYSNKKVKGSDDDGVSFEDGSCVTWASRTVVNCGTGEIRLVEDERAAQPAYDQNKTEHREELPFFDKLEIQSSFSCDVHVVASPDGQSRLYAQGSPLFIAMIETAVSGETLYLQIKSPENGAGRQSHNLLTVEVGFARGKLLKTTINGCSGLQTALPFDEGVLTVNGSGDIETGDLGALSVVVNGSGDVHVGDVTGDVRLTVNGSGDIEAGDLGALSAAVNGSGDVKVKRAAEATVRVAGAGDIAVDRIEERLDVGITGSGDIRCGGEVQQLRLSVTGSGELHAERLTAHEADLQLSDASSAHIGRIVGRSVERIGKLAELRVDRRG